MEKQESFAIIYDIDPTECADDEIENDNFSMRTFGKLKNNGIDTVEDLLWKTEVDLMSIKGFGRNSCGEALKFVRALRRGVNNGNQKSKGIRRTPYWAHEQRKLIFVGRFDELDFEYSEKDSKYVDSLREGLERSKSDRHFEGWL